MVTFLSDQSSTECNIGSIFLLNVGIFAHTYKQIQIQILALPRLPSPISSPSHLRSGQILYLQISCEPQCKHIHTSDQPQFLQIHISDQPQLQHLHISNETKFLHLHTSDPAQIPNLENCYEPQFMHHHTSDHLPTFCIDQVHFLHIQILDQPQILYFHTADQPQFLYLQVLNEP